MCPGRAADTAVLAEGERSLINDPTRFEGVRVIGVDEHVWRQDMSQAADPRAKLSRAAVRWALTGLVVHHLTVARVAQALGVSWKSR